MNVKVMKGKDGWLFLNNDTNRVIDQHKGDLLLDGGKVCGWDQLLSKRDAFIKSINGRHYFLIPPNAHSIFSEYLPDGIDFSPMRPVIQILSKTNSNVLYPFEELIRAKTYGLYSPYFKTDTHWNAYGAFIAYKTLVKRVSCNIDIPILSEKDIEFSSIEVDGDLGKKLTPVHQSQSVKGVIRNPHSKIVYWNGVNVRGRMDIFKNHDVSLPTCIVFGDSFFYPMLRYMKESFGTLVFAHRATIDYDLVKELKPQVVITEMNERFLTNLPNENNSPPTESIILEKLFKATCNELSNIKDILFSYIQSNNQFSNISRHHLSLVLFVEKDFVKAIRTLLDIPPADANFLQNYHLSELYRMVGDEGNAIKYAEISNEMSRNSINEKRYDSVRLLGYL